MDHTSSFGHGVSLSVAAATLMTLAACQGVIGDPKGAGFAADVEGGPTGEGGTGPMDCASAATVGPTDLRALGRLEYDNTVADLLGDTTGHAEGFASDVSLTGFASGIRINEPAVERFMEAAEAIAAAAVRDLGGLAACDLAVGDEACVRRFVTDFGRRAFRRPLTADEVSAYVALHAEAAARYDSATGVELVIETMLVSPSFLYHVELGVAEAGAPSVALSPFELASRLSFFLFRTTPDDALLAAAEAGELDDDAGYRDAVERMLDDDQARAAIEDFHLQWLGLTELDTLDKDASVQEGFDATFTRAMRNETVSFADYVIRRGDGRLHTLFTAPFSFPEGPLFELYGIDPATAGAPGEPTMLDPEERAGILTHASVLATHAYPNASSPIHRGVFVRTKLLCSPPPPPPPDVPEPPEPGPSETGRERFARHTSDPACQACHRLIDPIGFGFERYDAIGRFRTTEAGLPIDATGEVLDTDDADGAFDGAVELAARLADSDQVRACVEKQWFRYALDRSEMEADACARREIAAAFARSDGDLRELLVAIMTSDSFRRRDNPSPEM